MYTDVDSNQLDHDALEMRNLLKRTSVPQRLSARNIFRFKTQWSHNGLDPEYPPHAMYLHKLETSFLLEVERLINANFKPSSLNASFKELYDEVLFHSQFCIQQNKLFCGRDDILAQIRTQMFMVHDLKAETVKDIAYYLQQSFQRCYDQNGDKEFEPSPHDEQDIQVLSTEDVTSNEHLFRALKLTRNLPLQEYHKPILIHGISGSGKTALMARIHSVSWDWFQVKPVRIVRFIGASPSSCNIQHLILSTCQQIWQNYPDCHQIKTRELMKDSSYLQIYFNNLLLQIDVTEKPLLILWDGVDQLVAEDGSFDIGWLPLALPLGIHFIVSAAIDEKVGIIELAKQLLPEENILAMPIMPTDMAYQMLDKMLQCASRQVMPYQRDILIGAYKLCPQPLFLKLAFEQAKEWKSYTPADKCTLGLSIKSAIEQMLHKLEKTHGQVLVAKSLGRFCCSLHVIVTVTILTLSEAHPCISP